MDIDHAPLFMTLCYLRPPELRDCELAPLGLVA
jgi:hypothetical protein